MVNIDDVRGQAGYWDLIGRSLVPSSIPVTKFGRNPAVSTSTDEDIWDTGGDFVEPVTCEIVNLTGNALDDNTTPNTGARFVEVRGIGGPLGTEYDLVSEIVEMNGVTPAPTVNSYWFIHRMKVTEAGATGSNVGNIVATSDAVGNPVLATILATLNQTFMAMMQVPDGYNLVIKHWDSSIRLGAGGNGEYGLLVKPTGEVFQPTDIVGVATNAGTKRKTFEPLIVIPPRAIVKIRTLGLSAASMICSSSFMGALEYITDPIPTKLQI